MIDAKMTSRAGGRTNSNSKKINKSGSLLAFEMDPVYTFGRRQLGKMSKAEIARISDHNRADVVETLRGGYTTFHGPGQIVMYPILDLPALGIRLRDYIANVELAIIDTLKIYGINARTTENTGVWLDEKRKIASIGVRVRRGVTTHGLALNVRTDSYWFDRIVPCNLPNVKLVSMCDYVNADLATVSQQLTFILARRLNLVPVVENSSDILDKARAIHACVYDNYGVYHALA